MSEPPPEDLFVDRVMGEVARNERRLPLVVLALAVSALVLAVPALIALRVRPALDAAFSLAAVGAGELIAAISDNPLFWVAASATALWIAWLAWRALGGRT